MAVRTIVRLGHPALRAAAQGVEPSRIAEPELQTLIDDMIETMRSASGVGLAAPQLGIGLQIFVYEVGAEEGAELPSIPLRTVINPMVEPEPGELVDDWEGCLSIPGLRGLVPRHPAMRLRGLGREGESLDHRAEGLEARIVQHEYDHLNGVVFLDRMRDLRSLAFGEEWERYLAGEGEGFPGAAVG